MNSLVILDHAHEPLYRVVRSGAPDPLDVSHSQRRGGGYRWSTPDFPALYCCCSEWVARAVTLEKFRFAGVELSDLQIEVRPQLAEISWSGRVVDVTSPEGVAAAGFPPHYPDGVRKEQTRRAATEWHSTGEVGVAFRSAALQRRGFSHWAGPHQRWSEVAIFVSNCPQLAPKLLRRREDLKWLAGS